jgi:hypothetical protein
MVTAGDGFVIDAGRHSLYLAADIGLMMGIGTFAGKSSPAIRAYDPIIFNSIEFGHSKRCDRYEKTNEKVYKKQTTTNQSEKVLAFTKRVSFLVRLETR